MDINTLLKKIAKEICYRSLPSLKGRNVIIKSKKTSIIDIHSVICDQSPYELVPYELVPYECSDAVAKYGIQDLSFKVPATVLESNYQSGISLLQELGYVPPHEELEEARKNARETGMKSPDDPFCWQELAEDIAKGHTLLLLFMKGEPVFPQEFWSVPLSRKKKRQRMLKRASYFPREFKIIDACYTNARGVWFHRYFYM